MDGGRVWVFTLWGWLTIGRLLFTLYSLPFNLVMMARFLSAERERVAEANHVAGMVEIM